VLYSTTPEHCEQLKFDHIIDVRSPSEFKLGHILDAINLPVLDDSQHQEIGLLYKRNAFEASRKGASMVAANIASFLHGPLASIPSSAKILVYCWRGGERSQALAHILSSTGWKVATVKGGYKAHRKFTMEQISTIFSNPLLDLRLIAGYTGTGKTAILSTLKELGGQTIDLENLANHRGSLFGSPNIGEQPSQRQFESLLLREIQAFDLSKPVFIEAESSKIGELFCPAPLWKAMKNASVIHLECPLQVRVESILRDYSYFLEQVSEVYHLLDQLVKLRGSKLVEAWKRLLDENKWPELVRELLELHYDKAYREAGSENSPFHAARTKLELSSCTTAAYLEAARTLL
jgi:tRNA 2-selenouridine synthase